MDVVGELQRVGSAPLLVQVEAATVLAIYGGARLVDEYTRLRDLTLETHVPVDQIDDYDAFEWKAFTLHGSQLPPDMYARLRQPDIVWAHQRGHEALALLPPRLLGGSPTWALIPTRSPAAGPTLLVASPEVQAHMVRAAWQTRWPRLVPPSFATTAKTGLVAATLQGSPDWAILEKAAAEFAAADHAGQRRASAFEPPMEDIEDLYRNIDHMPPCWRAALTGAGLMAPLPSPASPTSGPPTGLLPPASVVGGATTNTTVEAQQPTGAASKENEAKKKKKGAPPSILQHFGRLQLARMLVLAGVSRSSGLHERLAVVAKKDPTDRTSQVQMHLKQMHQSRKLTKAPSCEWMLEAKLCRCVKEKPGAASDLVPDPIACGLQPLVYLDVRPSPIHALADWVGHPRHRVWRPWRVRLDTTLDPGTNERRHEYAVEMMDGTFAHLPVRASASALAKAMAQELYGFESFNARTVLERYGAQALWDRSARSTTQRPTLLLTRMARRWAADGKEAAERGTHLHALLEARLTGATPATPATKDEAATIDNIVATLDALGYTDLRSEVAMALPTADGGVFCGTADLLAVNEDNNVAVLDLKVTAKDLKIATQDRHGEKRLTYELACSLYALLAESPAAPLVLMVVNPDQSPPTIEFIEIDNKVDVVAGLLADHWPRLLERIAADHSAETANAAWMAPHDAEDHAEERLAQLWADQKRGYLSEATMRQAMRSMACARTRADVDRVYNAHHPSA